MGAIEVASQVKKIIDDLWASDIDRTTASQRVLEIAQDKEKRMKILRGDKPTAVFMRIMGVRRMVEFDDLYKPSGKK